MKRLLVIATVSVLLLSGCATQAPVDGEATSSPTSTSGRQTTTLDPGETSSADPNAGTGATPSDGTGDPLARTKVLWGDYDPGTQADIDALTAAGDCKSLDSQYGGAKANEEAVRATSGHGAQALLAYINEARALAACS